MFEREVLQRGQGDGAPWRAPRRPTEWFGTKRKLDGGKRRTPFQKREQIFERVGFGIAATVVAGSSSDMEGVKRLDGKPGNEERGGHAECSKAW